MSNAQVSGVTAIVLAAGTSTRMGEPKALVKIGGLTMLERVLASSKASCVDEIIVVLGHAAELIREQINLDGVRSVLNPGFKEGIASSIRVGIESVSPASEAALIVLADQPLLRPTTINGIIAAYKTKKPRMVLPFHANQRGNPVLLDRSVFDAVNELRGDVGFRSLFDKFPGQIAKLEVNDPGVLLDLDTRADLAALNDGADEMVV